MKSYEWRNLPSKRKVKRTDKRASDVPAYELAVISERYECHYCGMPADCLDHIPPISRYHDALYHEPSIKAILIPACQECNRLAGDELHTSFLERASFVKYKLTKKYKSQLNVAEWGSDELEDLSHGLRASIEKNMIAKEFVISRIRFQPKPPYK